MSGWKFKHVQKAQDVVILYFADPTSSALGVFQGRDYSHR